MNTAALTKQLLETWYSQSEDIEKAFPGTYLLGIELYRHTRDESIICTIAARLQLTDSRWKDKGNIAHGLFQGRVCMAWLYLQLYQVSSQSSFLERSTRVIKDHLDHRLFKLSVGDNAGLTNGMAGLLLVLTLIYHETKENWLCDHIDSCIAALADKAVYTPSGIYWNGIARRDNCHEGWGLGNTGIAFALLETGRYFNNQPVIHLARLALRYEDELMKEAKQDTSLFYGRLGQQLVKVYDYIKHDNQDYRYSVEALIKTCQQILTAAATGKNPVTLANGLAGAFAASREAWSLTGNITLLDLSEKMAGILAHQFEQENIFNNSSFFYGYTGVGHVLLRAGQEITSPSAILPVIAEKEYPFAAININNITINTAILQQHFKDSFAYLNKYHTVAFNEFLRRPLDCSCGALSAIMERPANKELSVETIAAGREVLEKELYIFNRWQCLLDISSDDNSAYMRSVQDLVMLGTEELKKLRIVTTKKMILYRKEEVIDFSDPITPEILMNIFTTYGYKSYAWSISRFNTLEETQMRINRLFLDLFDEPAEVGAVMNRLVDCLMNQDEKIVDMFMKAAQAASREELHYILSTLTLNSIRNSLIAGLMIIETASLQTQ